MGIREKFNKLRNKSELQPDKLVARQLMNGETVSVDSSESIKTDQYSFSKKLYPYGKLVAIIDAGGKNFGLIDVRDDAEHLRLIADFLLIDEGFDSKNLHNVWQPGYKGYKGIRKGEFPTTIGRNHLQSRFDYPSTTSKKHFELSYNDGLLRIHDLSASNPTYIYTKSPTRSEVDMMGGRTVLARDRAEQTAAYGRPSPEAPYGSYMNHPIIGRNSRSVENGVYMGGGSREAILVDNDSEILRQTYKNLHDHFMGFEVISQTDVLQTVNQYVQSIMLYDGNKVDDITMPYKGDKIVGLSIFIHQKAGVCRHQALLASYLIENLIKDKFLQGENRVQRNTVPDHGGTHAWALLIDRNGKEFVIDPAQNFTGSKEEARHQPGKWNYYLPIEEKPII